MEDEEKEVELEEEEDEKEEEKDGKKLHPWAIKIQLNSI